MDRGSARRWVIASAVLLLLSGCGGGDSTAGRGGSGSTPSPTASSAPVEVSQSVRDWVSEVCKASSATFKARPAQPSPDAGTSPEKLLADMLAATKELQEQASLFADKLEQLGPPDVEGGAVLTDAYVKAMRGLAAILQAGADAAAEAKDPVSGLAEMAQDYQDPELLAAFSELQRLALQTMTNQQLGTAAAEDPACQELAATIQGG